MKFYKLANVKNEVNEYSLTLVSSLFKFSEFKGIGNGYFEVIPYPYK